jgi:hypothetical protein
MTDQTPFSQAELLRRIEAGWKELQAYLDGLSEAQLTTPTDAAGWTPKDHVMHMAVWEDGIRALLNKESRIEAMGLDRKTWDSHDYDKMNDMIFRRYQNKSWAEVKRALEDVHRRLMETVQHLSTEDLERPYHHYDPDFATNDHAVWGYVVGNTFEHYAEHIPWMDVMIKQA